MPLYACYHDSYSLLTTVSPWSPSCIPIVFTLANDISKAQLTRSSHSSIPDPCFMPLPNGAPRTVEQLLKYNQSSLPQIGMPSCMSVHHVHSCRLADADDCNKRSGWLSLQCIRHPFHVGVMDFNPSTGLGISFQHAKGRGMAYPSPHEHQPHVSGQL
jgi:hypothetical protein